MDRFFLWGLLGVVLLAAGGALAYRYVKLDPPDFLIKLLAGERGKPTPLPAGTAAPLEVPEGFQATIFARDLPGARVLVRDPAGAMLVSLINEDKVVALRDTDQNGEADDRTVVLEGLNKPHGMAFMCGGGGACTLYIAETGQILSYDYDASTRIASNRKFVVGLPTAGGGHYTRTLLPHPDGTHLLVSIGSSCNVCHEETPVRASIQLLNPKTGNLTTYASGLRNSVFMATDPVTGETWATDNGRDLIGDDIPPDEVNIIKEGRDYGWPICYGDNIHDTDFDKRQYVRDPCADKERPFIKIQAHSAALGLAFVPEEGWPDGWGNDLLVALHGSWNRSSPVGYKVVRYDFITGRVMQDQFSADFVTGFLPEGESDTDNAIGRPVDILAEPGGVAYITDDRAGAIYRIALTEPAR